jgi:CHAD domain-containing protein
MSDKPALRPDLAVGEALRAIARDIVADARGALADPKRSDAVAVHDFRREMKRWRALLRLLEPFLADEGPRLLDEARDLARALGGARDAQSALDALADLAGNGLALSPRSLATVQGRIEAIRRQAEGTTLTEEMRQRLTEALDQAAAAVEHWPLHVLTFAEVAERLTRGYRAARNLLPADWTEADDEALHELRKRIVAHRYQMEMVVPLWRRFGRMWVGAAQRLRERLGHHQDLTLLLRLTQAHQPLAPWRSRLAPAIEARMSEHVRSARRGAQRLLVEKPKAFRRRLNVMWENGA